MTLKIGVSACFFHADPLRPVFKGKTLLYLEQSISHWIMAANALPLMLPATASESLRAAMVGEMDGLVLQGGSDVCPRSYGEEPLKPEWNGDAVRDAYELDLVGRFIAAGKPVLGVCRGLQLLNVAFGGTLYQDIELQVPAARNHRDWEIYDRNFHAVRPEPGTWLARAAGAREEFKVNTVHHQAIKELGKGLAVEARSPDGIIEAIRGLGESYVYGVQWHPEFEDPADADLVSGQPILQEFLEHVRARRPASKRS